MLIAIDVDQVVVDPSDKWCKYMSRFTKGPSEEWFSYSGGLMYYDLSKYYNIDRSKAFEFWNLPDLYDDLKPIRGSVEAVKAFKASGHEVIFLSKCTDGHKASKLEFLKRYFGADSVLINSHTKGVCDGFIDVMIDDHVDVLNEFTGGRTQCLLFASEFTQDEQQVSSIWPVDCWRSVKFLLSSIWV
jgi:5'(3')-deoxyribonucleotidase